jgi:hypothetical protein
LNQKRQVTLPGGAYKNENTSRARISNIRSGGDNSGSISSSSTPETRRDKSQQLHFPETLLRLQLFTDGQWQTATPEARK